MRNADTLWATAVTEHPWAPVPPTARARVLPVSLCVCVWGGGGGDMVTFYSCLCWFSHISFWVKVVVSVVFIDAVKIFLQI